MQLNGVSEFPGSDQNKIFYLITQEIVLIKFIIINGMWKLEKNRQKIKELF